ncbi:enoyl-CoA hydratase [Sandarakinorhabdus cyanobacteriorum]|uniref:Enoyl-CoA hydratase n=1 Tax=Sandarakinorhabdus cyanobacteriorum TaxID=1981098 RepID=A0A255Y780_9SPHN|nr:enoyl-CoA hydratase-related protein [Sandarakinorhabdus cyanobacteriorum]OYQ24300.1 enoyl-CoA hydratase [Sandarakinorhabdus cyanobacteriorum]
MLDESLDDYGTARLTLNRPERHNAFNADLIAALTEGFTRLGQANEVRAIVLSGAGKSFSAGADLDWMRAAAGWSAAENEADATRLSDMLAAINDCPKPVIVVAHGHVTGGGVGLVACADMAVAVDGTQFRLSEVRLGLTPATISPFVMAKIGARARRWFLTAEAFDAATAQSLGLVDEVAIDADAAEAVVAHWLTHIGQAAPGAVADAKRLALDFAGQAISDELRADTARRIAARRTVAEGREGINAFLSKGKPSWVIE